MANYVLYEVPAKMTLYSVAKEHNTTVTALMAANPELWRQASRWAAQSAFQWHALFLQRTERQVWK
jgi:non-ribosomal peptide synthetase component E (peptide arylation enzyme)